MNRDEDKLAAADKLEREILAKARRSNNDLARMSYYRPHPPSISTSCRAISAGCRMSGHRKM